MTRRGRDANRALLFRSYLYLVGGLLAVALILDFGFGLLVSRQEPEIDPFLETTLHLLEERLALVPPDERAAAARAMGDALGFGLQVLDGEDVFLPDAAGLHVATVTDAGGNVSYLYQAPEIDALLRLGPVVENTDSLLLSLLPPLFYLSIFVVVGIWLRPLLRDVNRITEGTRRFAADYREPVSTAAEVTELTDLAQNIDAMSARISGLLRGQKELIAALSHEMRTPLARIRFALAVIADRGDSELKAQAAALDADVQEIDDLIASMLSYARLDHPDTGMHLQAVPAGAWLEQVVAKSRAGAIDVSVSITTGTETVWMDPRLMELALSNLLVNACRYSDTRVVATMSQSGDEVELTVEDDGRGVPVAERETVFKAFTRVDDSRNRDTGGYGLGLAIVARVAELHGGAASVGDSETLGGARFVVRWPARTHP